LFNLEFLARPTFSRNLVKPPDGAFPRNPLIQRRNKSANHGTFTFSICYAENISKTEARDSFPRLFLCAHQPQRSPPGQTPNLNLFSEPIPKSLKEKDPGAAQLLPPLWYSL
jgi:hypothetical protein